MNTYRRLDKLVQQCREAGASLETARERGDRDDRDEALSERDASQGRLGAEWPQIAAALEEVARSRRAYGELEQLARGLDYPGGPRGERHSPETRAILDVLEEWRPCGGAGGAGEPTKAVDVAQRDKERG